jgi:hypothetical protein
MVGQNYEPEARAAQTRRRPVLPRRPAIEPIPRPQRRRLVAPSEGGEGSGGHRSRILCQTVAWAERLLADRQRLHKEQLRAREVGLSLMQEGEEAETGRDQGVLRAECLLVDRKRPLIERRRALADAR